jgi:hypothetical protein
MRPTTRQKTFKKHGRPLTLKDLLLRDWRAKFVSFIIGVAIWAVIKPLVEEKKRYPGNSPGGGSASVFSTSPAKGLARNP